MSKFNRLSQVLAFFDLDVDSCFKDRVLNHLHSDSRAVQESDVFVAIHGASGHRLQFLDSVLAKKPALILSSKKLTEAQVDACHQADCPVFFIAELEEQLAQFSHAFYGNPSSATKVIGITGTNGKTSCALFTAQLLDSLGHSVAIIGTLGAGHWRTPKPMGNTTPDTIRLAHYLYDFSSQNIEYVVMEVSSHALVKQRVQGVEFEVVALTQVTSDHLDFHGSLAKYRQAKSMLFEDCSSRFQLVNLNDSLGQTLFDQYPNFYGYRVKSNEGINTHSREFSACVATSFRGLEIDYAGHQASVALIGGFNGENVLCAIGICQLLGVSVQDIMSEIEGIQSVPGRMEWALTHPVVIVDFAHTEDAIKQVLSSIRQHFAPSQLSVIFGCGGDRDRSKRAPMAKAVQSYADRIYVSSDNPRFENPDQIINDICKGFDQTNSSILVEMDRSIAIEQAMLALQPNDVLVVLGKGHEPYQDIQGQKIPYSDFSVIKDVSQRTLFTERMYAN